VTRCSEIPRATIFVLLLGLLWPIAWIIDQAGLLRQWGWSLHLLAEQMGTVFCAGMSLLILAAMLILSMQRRQRSRLRQAASEHLIRALEIEPPEAVDAVPGDVPHNLVRLHLGVDVRTRAGWLGGRP
jgi:hypothetical protein